MKSVEREGTAVAPRRLLQQNQSLFAKFQLFVLNILCSDFRIVFRRVIDVYWMVVLCQAAAAAGHSHVSIVQLDSRQRGVGILRSCVAVGAVSSVPFPISCTRQDSARLCLGK